MARYGQDFDQTRRGGFSGRMGRRGGSSGYGQDFGGGGWGGGFQGGGQQGGGQQGRRGGFGGGGGFEQGGGQQGGFQGGRFGGQQGGGYGGFQGGYGGGGYGGGGYGDFDQEGAFGGGWGGGMQGGQDDDASRIRASEIMTENPETVTPDTPLAEAAKKMRDLDVGIIPVVDSSENRRLRGVVTDRDIAIRAVAEGKDAKNTKVSDIMTAEIETCNKNDSVRDILDVMEREQVRRVPITDREGRLVGIVAQADVAVDYAEERGGRKRRVARTLGRISEPAEPERGGGGGGMQARGRGGSQGRGQQGGAGGTKGRGGEEGDQ